MPRLIAALAGMLVLVSVCAPAQAMPAWDTAFARPTDCTHGQPCRQAGRAPVQTSTRCAMTQNNMAIAVRAIVKTPQPTCDQARALAQDALTARFRWVIVSGGRWWTRGVASGDRRSWSAFYHHYDFAAIPTRIWTVRLRVIWHMSQTELRHR